MLEADLAGGWDQSMTVAWVQKQLVDSLLSGQTGTGELQEITMMADSALLTGPEPSHKSESEIIDSSPSEEVTSECELEENIWDAALLLGHHRLGILVNGFAFGVLFVNVFIQLVLTIVISQSLTAPEFDSSAITGFRTWRTNVAVTLGNHYMI